jgi:hypothetical protein
MISEELPAKGGIIIPSNTHKQEIQQSYRVG